MKAEDDITDSSCEQADRQQEEQANRQTTRGTNSRGNQVDKQKACAHQRFDYGRHRVRPRRRQVGAPSPQAASSLAPASVACFAASTSSCCTRWRPDAEDDADTAGCTAALSAAPSSFSATPQGSLDL